MLRYRVFDEVEKVQVVCSLNRPRPSEAQTREAATVEFTAPSESSSDLNNEHSKDSAGKWLLWKSELG